MHHHRQMPPGPMAATSMRRHSRKSSAFMCKFTGKLDQPHGKEIVSVQTSTIPVPDRHIFREEVPTVYEGTVNLLSIIDTNKEVICCKYTEDMNEITVGFADGVIRLFECNSGTCKHVLVDDEIRASPGPVTAIQHRPVSKAHPTTQTILATYINGCIKCWKYKYDQCLYTIREKRQTLGLTYHPRFSKFITYGDDAKLLMYDEEAQTQERGFYSSQRKGIIDGHTNRVFACSFNPIAHHELISGGWDNLVMFWDDRQPYTTKYLSGVHICGEGLEFDKTGRRILTCAWQHNNSIQVWDYGSAKLIETIVPDSHVSKLYCGRFAPTSSVIVCGGSDENMLRVVDLHTKTTACTIRNCPGPVYALDFGHVRKKSGARAASDLQHLPRVSFVTGNRLQTVDFG